MPRRPPAPAPINPPPPAPAYQLAHTNLGSGACDDAPNFPDCPKASRALAPAATGPGRRPRRLLRRQRRRIGNPRFRAPHRRPESRRHDAPPRRRRTGRRVQRGRRPRPHFRHRPARLGATERPDAPRRPADRRGPAQPPAGHLVPRRNRRRLGANPDRRLRRCSALGSLHPRPQRPQHPRRFTGAAPRRI